LPNKQPGARRKPPAAKAPGGFFVFQLAMPVTPVSRLPHFDPRLVPVIGIDAHLPRVPREQLTPEGLRRRFASPVSWEPEVVLEKKFADRAPAHAAVLVPIVMRGPGAAAPTVLLTERTAHLSTHSGQIAFPGGKRDDTDEDAVATALREAHEEVGLERRYVHVMGTLPTYITGTSFIITPVVALIEPGFRLKPNPYEVADAFEVPLDFLMNPANHHRHAFEWEGVRREWFSMPFYEPRPAVADDAVPQAVERFIWGATAGMLRNFYRFLSA
jgi:8-oxo-dGTP pyrophosphatase MutT (NUDIX family)